MTVKERIIATIEGAPCDCLPFVPRLDNWYRANKLSNTLPDRYKHASLREIADDCGFGYHALNPDFLDLSTPDGDIHAGLGIYDLNLTPHRVKFHNVGINVTRDGKGSVTVEYDTPKGKITTRTIFDERMRNDGATIPVTVERAVKSIEDLPAMNFILQNAEVVPNYEKLAVFHNEFIGNRGLTGGYAAVFCSPFHYMCRELMAIDTFYYAMAEDIEILEEFADSIDPFINKIVSVAAESPSDVILCGSNFDSYVTAPSMFEEYMVPSLQKHSALIHENGKYLVCHTDGENTGLLDKYLQCGFDIADSICPSPMTKRSLKEVYDTFDGKITIWGGIPSTCMLEENMNQKMFEETVEMLIASVGSGKHMIFSIADTLPPAAPFERVLYIQKRLEEFGPVK